MERVGKSVASNHSETDEKYLWHHLKPYNPEATMIAESSSGAWVTTDQGETFLDGMSGLWCANIGYGREELAQTAFDQMKKLSYFPLSHSHQPAIDLAEKISDWLGGDYVVFFSNSGSEANESAFKIARQYHQQTGNKGKYKFISRYRGYHGNTSAALAATGQFQRKYLYEPLAPGFLHVHPPDSYRDEPYVDRANEMDLMMKYETSESIAGVIMEPIISGGGILIPPDDYMTKVKKICEEHHALLIADEVVCGFGRMGEKFGHQHYGVKPDIVTMAKGLTGGYLPLSATAVRRDIYESFNGDGEFDFLRQNNTFGGHPVSCAVALKNLEILERENLVEQSNVLGEKLLTELKELEAMNNVGNVRGKGLMIGMELVTDKMSKEPIDVEKVNQVIAACKNRNVIIGKNGVTAAGFDNVLTVAPPLSITDQDLVYIVKVLKESVTEVLT
ncbi:aspartate aminotransferase family protein [Virgibacillus byunsanensis]|uniref:Aspartate aminotransferase family protein n=1 Tax=Virgibacillus byunsanensis TaxID=570945 RepID=A0ABW3LIB2_9BACI